MKQYYLQTLSPVAPGSPSFPGGPLGPGVPYKKRKKCFKLLNCLTSFLLHSLADEKRSV